MHYYLRYCHDHHPNEELTDDIAKEYILHRYALGLDWQTVNSDYSSIQKFYKNIILMPWNIKKIPRPRKEKKLPTILSKEDVVKIIENAPTYKQQVLLTFIYTTGMRLSESINVCFEDIDSNRLQIRVNKGKGNKDRFILVPPVLIDLLRDYYKKVKPIKYLFNGIHKGKPYSPRSVQLTMAQSKKLAHINKKCSIHTLRNCYATHHLEGGTDLVFLQEQMGHKNLRTTIRYIGLCVERHRYIKHPIDSLQIRYQPNRGIPTPIA
ncbi:MAG: tyrosine-type recombinase/integrase [Saprospiraceae bacterium]|nr:tyrosine-type recombinase/integrase [Saprospiraceae bacterium]MBK9679807.1 tyrosine-type recombinase/integrase [Saprospiraceae bacterium]